MLLNSLLNRQKNGTAGPGDSSRAVGVNDTCQSMMNDPPCPTTPSSVTQVRAINLHPGPVRAGQPPRQKRPPAFAAAARATMRYSHCHGDAELA